MKVSVGGGRLVRMEVVRAANTMDARYPLPAKVCESCAPVQLVAFVTADAISMPRAPEPCGLVRLTEPTYIAYIADDKRSVCGSW